MARRRPPAVPHEFYLGVQDLSWSDLAEIAWDLMIQSPWFDEASAEARPEAVADKALSIVGLYKAIRETK